MNMFQTFRSQIRRNTFSARLEMGAEKVKNPIRFTHSHGSYSNLFKSTIKLANQFKCVVQRSGERSRIELDLKIGLCKNTLDPSQYFQSVTNENL